MQTPSLSPGRLWAARLTLLLACIGSIATSKASSPVTSWEVPLTPLTLSRESPKAVRHLRIEVTEQKPSSRLLDLHLRTELTARWTPDSPNQTLAPTLRARMLAPPDFESDSQWMPSYGGEASEGRPATGQVVVSASRMSLECKPDPTCAWTLTLEVERQANDPGTVTVEGKDRVELSVLDQDALPPGLQVNITEE
jgi:hypothetical protein